MDTHVTPETLLLYGLGRPLGGPIERALAAHVDACGRCRDRLDLVLAARFGDEAAAAGSEPLRAAASATRAVDAPAPPELLGTAKGPHGGPVPIYGREDAPTVFGLDRLALAGKPVVIRGGPHRVSGGAPRAEGEGVGGDYPLTIACTVDRFGRVRLSEADAKALSEQLAAGVSITIDVA